MKRAGIIVNKEKNGAYGHLEEVARWLLDNGCEVLIDKIAAKAIGFGQAAEDSEIFSSSDFLVVLGGDGTILHIASDAAFYGVPVLGINLGNMGYLTDADFESGFRSLEKVLKGEYIIEKRMALTAEFSAFDGAAKKPVALNEICVFKGALSRMIRFDISLNGSRMNTFLADGVIAATPTGSTAYNLSAKGPVLNPDEHLIAITPICPHDLFALPLVVSGGNIIEIAVDSRGGGDCALLADGHLTAVMKHGGRVLIKASEYYVNIIKTNDLSFFDVLRKKMSVGINL